MLTCSNQSYANKKSVLLCELESTGEIRMWKMEWELGLQHGLLHYAGRHRANRRYLTSKTARQFCHVSWTMLKISLRFGSLTFSESSDCWCSINKPRAAISLINATEESTDTPTFSWWADSQLLNFTQILKVKTTAWKSKRAPVLGCPKSTLHDKIYRTFFYTNKPFLQII